MTSEIYRRLTILRSTTAPSHGNISLEGILDEIETLLKSNEDGYQRTIMNLSASLKNAQETVTACQSENTRLVELRRAAEAELPFLRRTMQDIMQTLGPDATCECSGCAWETNEAIRLLNTVGIEYQPRGKKRMEHNVEAERRGNETS